MGNDKKFWIVVPSGEGGGNGIGEGYTLYLNCVCNVQKNLKENKMLKLSKAGWLVSQVFVTLFISFSMFLICYNLKIYFRKKSCVKFAPTQNAF